MIRNFKVLHFEADADLDIGPGEHFLLKTCQRSLVASFGDLNSYEQGAGEVYHKKEAYHFLLEIICGLKSELLGENEIVAQFKEAYAMYTENDQRDSRVMKVLEKLFKDSKEIRTNYLTNIGQQSYSALCRKILSESSESKEVLILGSGKLATDLLKIMTKKFSVTLSARNIEKGRALANAYGCNFVTFSDNEKFFQFPNIVNTIGTEHEFLENSFFKAIGKTKKMLFIDLANPAAKKDKNLDIHNYTNLDDVFKKAKTLVKDKNLKIEKAKNHIETLSTKRFDYFLKNSLLKKTLTHA